MMTYERTVSMILSKGPEVSYFKTDRNDFISAVESAIKTSGTFRVVMPLFAGDEKPSVVLPLLHADSVNYIAFYGGKSLILSFDGTSVPHNGFIAKFTNGQTLRLTHNNEPTYIHLFKRKNFVLIKGEPDSDDELLLYVNNANVASISFYSDGEQVG